MVHQSLGTPILKWTAKLGEDPAFQTLAYEVLKKWIALEYVNLTLRTIHTQKSVRWKTNEVPFAEGVSIMSHPSELDEDLRTAAPYLNKLAVHAMTDEKGMSFEFLGMYLLARWMRERGVPESKWLASMMEARIGHRSVEIDLQLKIEKT